MHNFQLTIACTVAYLIGQCCYLPVIVLAQDQSAEIVREIFVEKNIPWFDAASDSVRPVEIRTGDRAASLNRAEIETRYLPEKKQNTPKNTPATTTKSGPSMFAGIIPWLFVTGVLVVLSALLLWAFFKRESVADRQTPAPELPQRSDAERIEQLPFEVSASQTDFRHRAEQAMTKGEYQSAAIFLFSFVLISLDQRGLIRLRRGSTNREYLRDIFRFDTIADYYQQVMLPFEDAFFGGLDVSQAKVETCFVQLDEFLSNVERESKAIYS